MAMASVPASPGPSALSIRNISNVASAPSLRSGWHVRHPCPANRMSTELEIHAFVCKIQPSSMVELEHRKHPLSAHRRSLLSSAKTLPSGGGFRPDKWLRHCIVQVCASSCQRKATAFFLSLPEMPGTSSLSVGNSNNRTRVRPLRSGHGVPHSCLAKRLRTTELQQRWKIHASICKMHPPMAEFENHKHSLPSQLRSLSSCAKTPPSGGGFRPDKWLRHCIVEVVENIQEAPFLQLVFDSRDNTKLERKLIPFDPRGDDLWCCSMKDAIAKAAPDGVILVQKLRSDISLNVEDPSMQNVATEDSQPCNLTDSSTDVWGLLLLGGSPAKNACYVLETTRVSSCGGVCTRFCLTRAQCFGPSVRDQLEKMWLVNSSE